MSQIKATATSIINAAPQVVYQILADYHDGHPKILPEQYFSDITIEHGGTGAGTLIQFQTHMLGQSKTVRVEITEPEPGRVLAETDVNTGMTTTFTVEPIEDGKKSSVTIKTEWNSSGIKGLLERLMAPPMLRRVYKKELHKLAKLAESAT